MDGAASSTPQQLSGGILFRAHAAPLEERREQQTIKQLLRLVQEPTYLLVISTHLTNGSRNHLTAHVLTNGLTY